MQGRLNYTLRPRILCLDTATLMVYSIVIFYVFLDWKNYVVHNILAEMQDKNSLPDEVAYNFLIYWFPHWKDFPSSLHCLSAIMSRRQASHCCLRNMVLMWCFRVKSSYRFEPTSGIEGDEFTVWLYTTKTEWSHVWCKNLVMIGTCWDVGWTVKARATFFSLLRRSSMEDTVSVKNFE